MILMEDEDVLSEMSFEGNLPELIHIFSKRDRMGFEGYKR